MAPPTVRKKAPPPAAAKKPRKVRQNVPAVDEHAYKYAQLLADPCNAELTPSIFAGADGALLARFERDFIINNGATDIGSAGYFCPGVLSSFATRGSIGTGGPWSSDSIPGSLAHTGPSNQPGYNFLSTNASAVRCVSACVQVAFVGKELDRSGIIGIGACKFSQVTPELVTLGQLRTLAADVKRLPDDIVEYRLPPTSASAIFVDPSNVNDPATETLLADMPTIFWTVSGIPVSTGVRVRFVAVYEWVPRSDIGMVSQNMGSPAQSKASLNDVLGMLARSAPHWLRDGLSPATRKSLARTAHSIYRFGTKMGPALLALA